MRVYRCAGVWVSSCVSVRLYSGVSCECACIYHLEPRARALSPSACAPCPLPGQLLVALGLPPGHSCQTYLV